MTNVGVVGAGLMGSEIALVFALAGHDVLLADRNQQVLDSAMGRLNAVLDKGVAHGRYVSTDADAALDRLRTTVQLADFTECSLVTEAVFESIDVKRDVLQVLDGICGSACVFASNTSTIPISTIAALLKPERRFNFVGTHYFSPVSRMKLVEVIPGFDTSAGTTEYATTMLAEIGKVPILVKDVAGFAVNRMLHAFLIEAVRLVDEGVAAPSDLDTACRLGLGHPIGPFALMDAVTSGLCVQVQDIMMDAYGERFRPPPLLRQRVLAGYGGGKRQSGLARPSRIRRSRVA